MGTNDLSIDIYDSPKDAPIYRQPPYRGATLVKAAIVGKGTEAGKATVDLIFTDNNDQQFVAMVTGNILRMVVAAIDGVEQRD